jgi:hypothetical protein
VRPVPTSQVFFGAMSLVTVHGQVSPTDLNNFKKNEVKKGLMQASESPSESCLSLFCEKTARIPQ